MGALWIEWHADRRLEAAIYPSIEVSYIAVGLKYTDFRYKLHKLSSFLCFSPPSSQMIIKSSGYVHGTATDRMACRPPIRSSNLSLYRGIMYRDMTQILGFSIQTV